jgi:hypothetical protein
MPALTPSNRLGFGIVIVRIVGVTCWLGGVVRDLEVSQDLELLVVRLLDDMRMHSHNLEKSMQMVGDRISTSPDQRIEHI